MANKFGMPTPPTRRHITPGEQAAWSQWAQFFVIEGITQAEAWGVREAVFHGGTSLHMAWQSPRASLDMNFMLVEQEVTRLKSVMRVVEGRVEERFRAISPDFQIEMRDKTRDAGRLAHYDLAIGKRGVIGNAIIKTDFWKVTPEFLEGYRSELRQLITPDGLVSRMDAFLPTPTIEMAYCDKLVAFATRPFVKWRDIFDVWWLRVQNRCDPLQKPDFDDLFLHGLSAYQIPNGQTPVEALRAYLAIDDAVMLAKAEKDLRPWLPDQIWSSIQGPGIADMLTLVKSDVARLVERLENRPAIAPAEPDEPPEPARHRG